MDNSILRLLLPGTEMGSERVLPAGRETRSLRVSRVIETSVGLL